mmetsp:Transcript_76695/g.151745  ORF Transcript_76695/g.151745 Transcript_76695/m.151745 type:complete len:97 (-) Transcript_76695:279-569(-)
MKHLSAQTQLTRLLGADLEHHEIFCLQQVKYYKNKPTFCKAQAEDIRKAVKAPATSAAPTPSQKMSWPVKKRPGTGVLGFRSLCHWLYLCVVCAMP